MLVAFLQLCFLPGSVLLQYLSNPSYISSSFGSNVRSTVTGIVYNNEMDDFSTPGQVNAYGVEPSPSNFIRPGKRPMSSMSPVIVTNSTSGDVLFIAGASGGTRITTGTALVRLLGFLIHAHDGMPETKPSLTNQPISEDISYPTIPYHTTLHHTTPHHTIAYQTIPNHTIPYHTIPYHTIPYHTIPYHTIPYHIPYHTIPHHTTPQLK